ncbi:MAG: hypothetical protein HOQ32_11870 [Lysobacter sp.]|nr:hypothetical protein [Lysobacter sp.]
MKRVACGLAGLAVAVSLSGCATVGDAASTPGCLGIPGEFAAVEGTDRADPATHGPGAPGAPVTVRAIRQPFGIDVLPPLYVYGPQAEPIGRAHTDHDWLKDPSFAAAEQSAYWGELVDGHFFSVPDVGDCELAEMLGGPIGLRAPEGGLLFVQFVSSDCPDCARLSEAIGRVIAEHPQNAFRWVRVRTSLPVR